MHTVFSHIIQKRFSSVNEDVATDALAYVLESSDAARRGMTKLLRGIIPDLPPLRFKTQQAEGFMRPDMCGFADTEPRVFVENKFWAGLTDNQPVAYLKRLVGCTQPAVLLVIAPSAREQSLWRELRRRLDDAGISVTEREDAPGVAFCRTRTLGPILALTSWASVLSVLEHEAVDDPSARGDLMQLRALCDAADNEAFAPPSREQLSDQRTAAFIVQLTAVVQAVVDHAATQSVLSVRGLGRSKLWTSIGRYVRLPSEQGAGAWIGIHFELWKGHGTTPLWLVFPDTEFGRGQEVRRLLAPLADRNRMLAIPIDRGFAIGLDLPTGEEKESVVRSLVDQLRVVGHALIALPPKLGPIAEGESDEVSA